MHKPFQATDILIPTVERFDNWAVIACDQFTSDRSYWDRVKEQTAGVPSTFHMVFPEIDLENNASERISSINQAMSDALNAGMFKKYSNAFVYVERTLLDGSIRPGIVGAVDLDQYHYDPDNKPVIGATEQTVLERVPPRIAVRRNADLEFPHIILFCNDMDNVIFNYIKEIKSQLPKLYDFMLMEEGGHIAGWLIDGKWTKEIQNRIDSYTASEKGTAILVADGNHSLVTAKCWYEELKQLHPCADLSDHPARFAMVELENIQDKSIHFEPIHRVIFNTDTDKLLTDILQICSADGCPIKWLSGDKSGTIKIAVPYGELPIAVMQRFLDQWLADNGGKIDYIHDADAVEAFSKEDRAIGFMMPIFDKKELFAFGASGHILPRKTFSLGHGREKRYYLEGRKIR